MSASKTSQKAEVRGCVCVSEGGGGGLLANVIVKMKLQSEGRDPEHASREGSVDMEVLD